MSGGKAKRKRLVIVSSTFRHPGSRYAARPPECLLRVMITAPTQFEQHINDATGSAFTLVSLPPLNHPRACRKAQQSDCPHIPCEPKSYWSAAFLRQLYVFRRMAILVPCALALVVVGSDYMHSSSPYFRLTRVSTSRVLRPLGCTHHSLTDYRCTVATARVGGAARGLRVSSTSARCNRGSSGQEESQEPVAE